VRERDQLTADAEPLIVPAWWDPKARRVVLDPTTFKVGLFMITGDAVAYVVEDQEIIAAELRDICVTWRRYRKDALDITVGDRSFRLYLSPPVKDAPALTTDRIDKITGVMSPAALGGLVGGAIGTASLGLSTLADVLKAPGVFAASRQGRRNGELIRQRLDRSVRLP